MQTTPFRFLDRGSEVEAYFSAIGAEAVLALDLEADSLHHYPEKICLVQVSTPAETAVLDPLATPAVLDGLVRVLADSGVRKILHGGDYDVRLLKRERGATVHNLFDTMIAAQLTGRERFGLAALLEEHFSVTLDKRHQRADWSRRPLGAELLAYAAADTAHLHGLAERLAAELGGLGRTAWAEEEFLLLERVDPGAPKPPRSQEFKGAGRLAPRQLARLQALLELREQIARAWDRPPFMVLANQVLIDLVTAPPSRRRELLLAHAGRRAERERVAERALDALNRADALPERECPEPVQTRRVPLGAAESQCLSSLRHAREEAADRLRLAPGLLVNGATLERLAREGAGAAGLLKDWQAEALGAPFFAALQKSGRDAGCAAPESRHDETQR